MTPALLVERLSALRDLLAPGWSEPFCRDLEGRICDAEDEGVATFSLAAALWLVSKDVDEVLETRAALAAVATPAEVGAEGATVKALETSTPGDTRAAFSALRCAGAGQTLEAWVDEASHEARMRLVMLALQRAKAKAREARAA